MQPVRSYLTRLLHLAILMVVIHQLLTSTVMERPMPGEDPELPYSLHTWIGTGGLFVLMLFWLWTLVRDRAEIRLSQLVPWFSPRRLQSIGDEALGVARHIVRLRAPSLDVPAISSAVHGLGLLLATFLAASGAAWFFAFTGGPYGRIVLGLHKLAGDLMWAYLIGHASMALLHQALGDKVFSRMFGFGAQARNSPAPAE
jgi:cytochrome b561